ncbi:hypothetical protein DPEC_G00367890 [Dallia pectoralis]|nr:hypothetical protein DPEC_G00367890 [Dallia pectoralis]
MSAELSKAWWSVWWSGWGVGFLIMVLTVLIVVGVVHYILKRKGLLHWGRGVLIKYQQTHGNQQDGIEMEPNGNVEASNGNVETLSNGNVEALSNGIGQSDSLLREVV